MTDRLYRSPTERVIAGVAGGLATWLNLDPSLVRVAWVLLAVVSGGIFVLVYFVMMLVVPLPPPGWVPQPRGAVGGGWPGGTPAAGSGAPGSPTPGSATPGSAAPGAIPGWQAGPGTTWGPPPGTGPAGGTATGSGWTTPTQPWVPPRVDPGNAGIVVGAVLVLLGAWFLVDQYLNVDWDLIWPVVVIVLGVALIAGAMRRGRASGG